MKISLFCVFLFVLTPFTAAAEGVRADNYSDHELLAAGWTQEQIDKLRGKSISDPPNSSTLDINSRYQSELANCNDEFSQVLDASKTQAKDVLSYLRYCLEYAGWPREIWYPVVTAGKFGRHFNEDHRIESHTRKPFSMLVRERREYEYEYCTRPIEEYILTGGSPSDRTGMDIVNHSVKECLMDFGFPAEHVNETVNHIKSIR